MPDKEPVVGTIDNNPSNVTADDRYKLEIKTAKTGSGDGSPVTSPIRLVVDWEDLDPPLICIDGGNASTTAWGVVTKSKGA